ncbi:hypothetical protein NON27_30475, partial [Vibrio parahaemolyticus]|nr:hypothetical protein [Vibrio parahaemolyticus]
LRTGDLGWASFAYIATDSRFEGIPLILEPIAPDIWQQEINTLRQFHLAAINNPYCHRTVGTFLS